MNSKIAYEIDKIVLYFLDSILSKKEIQGKIL